MEIIRKNGQKMMLENYQNVHEPLRTVSHFQTKNGQKVMAGNQQNVHEPPQTVSHFVYKKMDLTLIAIFYG